MIVVIGLIVGIILGLSFDPVIPAGLQPFLPVAVVAAMDQSVTHPGAAVLTGEYTEPIPAGIPPIPLAGDLESEWGELPESCDGVLNEARESQGASCSYLNTDDPELVEQRAQPTAQRDPGGGDRLARGHHRHLRLARQPGGSRGS